MQAYGFWSSVKTERDCVVRLMEMYAWMTKKWCAVFYQYRGHYCYLSSHYTPSPFISTSCTVIL